MIFDLPGQAIIVYPEHEFGDDSKPVFYRRIDKHGAIAARDVSAGKQIYASWTMGHGCESYEKLTVCDHDRGHWMIALHGTQPSPAGAFLPPDDLQEGREPGAVIECVTSRRTAYVESVGDSLRYKSYDYASDRSGSPSAGSDMLSDLRAQGNEGYDVEFRRGPYIYQFDVSGSSSTPKAALSVFKEGRRLQTENCSAYSIYQEALLAAIERVQRRARGRP